MIPIEKSDHDINNAFMIEHVNQKYAIKFEDELLPMINRELRQGFGIVLPITYWREIPNFSIAPPGLCGLIPWFHHWEI
jgi:hypothetical protein